MTNAVWIPGGVFFLLLLKFQIFSLHQQLLSHSVFPASITHVQTGNQTANFKTQGDRGFQTLSELSVFKADSLTRPLGLSCLEEEISNLLVACCPVSHQGPSMERYHFQVITDLEMR